MSASAVSLLNPPMKRVDRRMTMWLRSVFLLLCTLPCGCGSDHARTATVRGRVTIDGKVVTTGSIVFYPQEGRPAMGKIGTDGSYRLTTFKPDDGAIVGEHRVTIEVRRVISGGGPKTYEEELQGVGFSEGVVEWLVPRRYSQRKTSPLRAEVTRDSNTINFDL